MLKKISALLFILMLALAFSVPSHGQLRDVDVPALAPPSNSYYITAMQKAKKLDEKNGLRAKFKEFKTLGAFYADFTAKGTLISTGAVDTHAKMRVNGQAIKIYATWSTNNAAVLTGDPKIKSVEDLKGRSLAASKASGTYPILMYFAKKRGLDIEKDVTIVSAHFALARTYLQAGRTDAALVNEPAATMILDADPKFRIISTFNEDWKKYTGLDYFWYLDLVAWEDITKDTKMMDRIFNFYKDASDYIEKNPDESFKIISEATGIDIKSVSGAMKSGRLVFKVIPAEKEKESLFAAMRIAYEGGYIDKMPDEGIIYVRPKD